MVEVPEYLKECTRIKKNSKDVVILQASCNCGCSTFYLLRNVSDAKEDETIKEQEKRISKWHRIENYTDPVTRTRYLVAKNIFGKIIDKIPVSDIKGIKRTHIIKTECSECGKQSVIFDNRYHGYDAIANNIPADIECKEYQYKLIRKEPTEVEIRIRNDLTYNEYCEEVNESSVEEFPNAFSNIEIYAVKDGKKKKCFEEETA